MSDAPKSAVQAADVHQVNDWLERNEILLVDVRETSEYEKKNTSRGAVLLPLSSFEPDMFPTLPGKKVVLHCAVGKRSEAAGKMLLKEGHEDVIHMTGGIEAWKAAGYPTEMQLEPIVEEPAEPVFLCPPPGKVLLEEYLKPLKITPQELAHAIRVFEGRITDVLAGKSPVGGGTVAAAGALFQHGARFLDPAAART
ncbi:rhodanese-like domain-containing protein [Jhaorihella thermophila]